MILFGQNMRVSLIERRGALEAGQVQLVVDARVVATISISFQAITLARA